MISRSIFSHPISSFSAPHVKIDQRIGGHCTVILYSSTMCNHEPATGSSPEAFATARSPKVLPANGCSAESLLVSKLEVRSLSQQKCTHHFSLAPLFHYHLHRVCWWLWKSPLWNDDFRKQVDVGSAKCLNSPPSHHFCPRDLHGNSYQSWVFQPLFERKHSCASHPPRVQEGSHQCNPSRVRQFAPQRLSHRLADLSEAKVSDLSC